MISALAVEEFFYKHRKEVRRLKKPKKVKIKVKFFAWTVKVTIIF